MGASTFTSAGFSAALGASAFTSADFSAALGASVFTSAGFSAALGASAFTSAGFSAALGASTFTSAGFSAALGASTFSAAALRVAGFLAGALVSCFTASAAGAFSAAAFGAAFLAAGLRVVAFLAGAFFSAASAVSAAFLAAGLRAARFFTGFASVMVQYWFSPSTSCQIWARVPFSALMPTRSTHLPDTLDFTLKRPSLVASSTHSWLEPLAPSHWCSQVPSAVPQATRSSILPVNRLQMRYTPWPARTKDHCCHSSPV